MDELPDREDLCDNMDEILSYCESDYMREKWSLPEKAEAIKAYIWASKTRDEWLAGARQAEWKSWLESLVGCDCDNGMRYFGFDGVTRPDTAEKLKCGRCVLVEAGGIRVRVDKPATDIVDDGAADPTWLLLLPAVEVADEV